MTSIHRIKISVRSCRGIVSNRHRRYGPKYGQSIEVDLVCKQGHRIHLALRCAVPSDQVARSVWLYEVYAVADLHTMAASIVTVAAAKIAPCAAGVSLDDRATAVMTMC